MNIEIRQMRDGDAHYLVSIDQKSYEYPYEIFDWQLLERECPDWKIMILLFNQYHCGCSVTENNKDGSPLRVHKLAVLPAYRGRGLGSMLLDRAEQEGIVYSCPRIEIPVPETSCRGKDDPYDVSEWLLHRGYRCAEIQPDSFDHYGRKIDGYLFTKELYPIKDLK